MATRTLKYGTKGYQSWYLWRREVEEGGGKRRDERKRWDSVVDVCTHACDAGLFVGQSFGIFMCRHILICVYCAKKCVEITTQKHARTHILTHKNRSGTYREQ